MTSKEMSMTIAKPLLVGFSLLVFAAASTYAGENAKDKSASQASPAASGASEPQAKKQPFGKLDTDRDGYLGHSEAAADRDAASRFDQLDTDGDEKVSRAEYDAWDKGGSKGAASGATGGEPRKATGGEPRK